MSVRVEKDGPIWTVIHSRPEARNAMDPKSAAEIFKAFQSFDADKNASPRKKSIFFEINTKINIANNV